MQAAELFQKQIVEKLQDKEQFANVKNSIKNYESNFVQGIEQFVDLSIARKRAEAIRHKGIENMEKYLTDFEYSFIRRGGKVIWATDSADALKEIDKILSKEKATTIVKSKSMVTEEIGLENFLKEKNIECVEGDLGAYIQQLSGEVPFHLVTPAMHKKFEVIKQLFIDKKGLSPEADETEVMDLVRKDLREKVSQSKVTISGANFLLADVGAVAVTENEGNFLLAKAQANTHIIIAGIEKILPTAVDLDLFWPLLASHATGQQLAVYNSLIYGPSQEGEKNMQKNVYVILLDNGRSEILAQTNQRKTLGCIKCGACLNVCPVWQHIGGAAYGTTYTGPIGKVMNQFLRGEDFKHLSYASTLCGKCTEVCPVNIDIHKQLLYNRRHNAEEGNKNKSESISLFFWKNHMLKRSKMEKGGAKVKNFMLKQFFKKQWGENREMPKIENKSFNQIWRETRL